MYSADMAMNTFSTTPKVPLTTKSHMATAAMGMLMSLGTPNISMAAAMPANSATVVARLATRSVPRANMVHLTPKFSRISSPRPFWVTQPILAHIS